MVVVMQRRRRSAMRPCTLTLDCVTPTGNDRHWRPPSSARSTPRRALADVLIAQLDLEIASVQRALLDHIKSATPVRSGAMPRPNQPAAERRRLTPLTLPAYEQQATAVLEQPSPRQSTAFRVPGRLDVKHVDVIGQVLQMEQIVSQMSEARLSLASRRFLMDQGRLAVQRAHHYLGLCDPDNFTWRSRPIRAALASFETIFGVCQPALPPHTEPLTAPKAVDEDGDSQQMTAPTLKLVEGPASSKPWRGRSSRNLTPRTPRAVPVSRLALAGPLASVAERVRLGSLTNERARVVRLLQAHVRGWICRRRWPVERVRRRLSQWPWLVACVLPRQAAVWHRLALRQLAKHDAGAIAAGELQIRLEMGRRVQLLAKRYAPDLDKQCLAHIVRDVMTRADANRLEVVSTGEHASVTDEGRTSGACAESLRKTVLRLGRPGSERPSACRWQVLLWLFFKRRRVMIDAIRQAWTQCNVEGREIVIVPQLWRDPWRVSNPRDDVRIEGAAR